MFTNTLYINSIEMTSDFTNMDENGGVRKMAGKVENVFNLGTFRATWSNSEIKFMVDLFREIFHKRGKPPIHVEFSSLN